MKKFIAKNLLLRMFAFICFCMGIAGVYFNMLGIGLSSGSWIFIASFACSVLLIIWSAVNILNPNRPIILLFPILGMAIIYSMDGYMARSKNMALCEELRKDPECKIDQSGVMCSQESIKYQGMSTSLKCVRTAEEIEKIKKYGSEKEKEILAKEIKDREELLLAEKIRRKNPEVKKEILEGYGFMPFDDDELADEELQTIATNYIFLLTRFNNEFEFKEKPLRVAFEKYYKLDFFLSESFKSSPLVEKLTQEYRPYYKENYFRFLAEAVARTGQLESEDALIHPDFFLDENFTTQYLLKCGSRLDDGTLKYPDSLKYFENEISLDNKVKEIFLKTTHGLPGFNPSCYPKSFLSDEDFILKLVQRYQHFQIEEKLLAHSSSLKLRELIMKRKTENTFRSLSTNPITINQISQEIVDSAEFQKILFLKFPMAIKYRADIKFHPAIAGDFISGRYKPARFFSDAQQKIPTINELLIKNTNDSKKFLEMEKIKLHNSFMDLECCGPDYTTGIRNLMSGQLSEIQEEANFHISVMESMKYPIHYIKEYGESFPISKELREYTKTTCKKNGAFKDLVYAMEFSPMFMKNDPDYFKELRLACSNFLKKSPPISNHFNEMRKQDHQNAVYKNEQEWAKIQQRMGMKHVEVQQKINAAREKKLPK